MIMGSLLGGRFSDWRRARMIKRSADGKVHSELRLADQIWGVLLCSAGNLMYGWFAQKTIHPAAVLVATFCGMHASSCTVSLKLRLSAEFPLTFHLSRLWNDLGLCHEYKLPHRMRTQASSERLRTRWPSQESCGCTCGCHYRALDRKDGPGLVFYWTCDYGLYLRWRCGHSAKHQKSRLEGETGRSSRCRRG